MTDLKGFVHAQGAVVSIITCMTANKYSSFMNLGHLLAFATINPLRMPLSPRKSGYALKTNDFSVSCCP
jgi:hypothetical protein